MSQRLVIVGVTVATIWLTGCSGSPPPKAPHPLPQPGPTSWADWRPTEPVRDLRQLSEAEKRAIRDSDLAQRAERLLDGDPPEVALERWIMPHEIGPTSEECLAAAGFTVTSHEDGHGFRPVSAVPESQAQAYNRAIFVCHARFFLDPTYLQPLTRDQLVAIHEYYETYLIPCLRENGQTPSPLSSRETFVATYLERPENPYSTLELDDDALMELTAICPQGPPTIALFGG